MKKLVNKMSEVNKEDMRGLFFIVKGQYRPGKGEVSIDGYDPSGRDTVEWYQVMDNLTFNTVCCGGDYNKVLKGVSRVIKDFKTREAYFKHLHEVTTEDYYFTHYMHRNSYTPEQVSHMVGDGKRSRTSIPMKDLYKRIYKEYGDYFIDDIEKQEDLGYETLKETPFSKSKKLFKRLGGKTETPVREEKEVIETPKKVSKIKPLKRMTI